MVDVLELTGTKTVLEIGTGYGYQTALLAHLARHVYSIEWWPDLAAAAIENLIRAGWVTPASKSATAAAAAQHVIERVRT